ncbi:MAG: hypothetical protein LBL59_04070 [Xanthomonadaceae bacterium]|nr:hypothetical protein [Xanthomonadaceae bacterium]
MQNQTEATPAKTTAQNPAPAQSAPGPANCPATAFPEFLPLFLNDEDIQRKYTRFPLAQLYLEDGDYSEVTENLSESEARFPLAPTIDEMNESGLSWNIESEDDKQAEVKIHQDGTGYLIRYFFAKDGCWTLVRIENLSV